MAPFPTAGLHRTRLAATLSLLLLGAGGSGAVQAQTSEPAAAGAAMPVVSTTAAGAKGAQVYCFMRSAGNSHEVSWTAAYALIKRQSASLFKTSPEHAAVMITEAVVQNPGSFPDCGKYLGSLFEKTTSREAAAPATEAGTATPSSGSAAGAGTNRYSY